MQPIVDYINRGGPVVGLRTATHAFKIPADSAFAKFDFQYKGDDFSKGFGRQILGENVGRPLLDRISKIQHLGSTSSRTKPHTQSCAA